MGSIMIRCPATKRAIATGIEMDLAKFQRTAVFFSRSYCPHCRTHHEWFARDAWIEETTPQDATEAA
ncbi:hypothetical protein SAMN05444158_1013 [Bradyrhizobium canariense]|uniref:Uncharacterized protein n=1 Tax=Bradyrhizobium canariense TaxID=255045 RepID=A0A1H1PG34_9BRAD|nr:hypothetical protein [Bradyrhizobium canariense]SDS10258.1 hypothetical protein SAMN05444158_1013 [Bradyrhizobium canariense]